MSVKIKEIAGFTLIELLIAVAVVGILAAIAYPSYTSSLQKTRRVDAIKELLNIQMAQEKYRAFNTSYADDFSKIFGGANRTTYTSGDGFYTITLVNSAANSFSASAAPAGSQAGDACGTFYVNQKGPDTATAGAANSSCWNQ